MPLPASFLRLLRRHWPLALVLAAAAIPRAAVAIAYRPALFFGDSWAYLDLAYGGSPVGFAPDRPSGYPLVIDLLSIPAGRSLAAITTVQHLAGLGVAVLVYALLSRLGMPRLVATAGAALVALDGYAIALEQQIMAEALFTLALVASLYLAVGRERGMFALATSGALLGAAATMRTAALFAVPVWIAYVVWSHGPSRRAAAGLVALILPLFVYSGLHAAGTGKFGLTQADGWFLYGRVGQFAHCDGVAVPREARPLCDRAPRDSREGAAFHVWNADGPARRAFGGMSRDPAVQERSNRALRQFAVAVIRERPLRYAEEVTRDFLRYFSPGEMSLGNSDHAVVLPARGRLVRRNEWVRDRYFPTYRPEVHEPAEQVRSYQQAVHTPRLLMGALAIASALSLLGAAALRGRVRMPRRRETFLLTGAALAMLLGSAATSEFVLRYLIPVVPLVVCGGFAALADLALLVRSLASPFSSGPGSRESGSRRSAIHNRPAPAPALSRRAGAAARAQLLARRP